MRPRMQDPLALKSPAPSAASSASARTFIPERRHRAGHVSRRLPRVGVTQSGELDPKLQLLAIFAAPLTLLILDNYEQLLEAAPRCSTCLECAPQVRT